MQSYKTEYLINADQALVAQNHVARMLVRKQQNQPFTSKYYTVMRHQKLFFNDLVALNQNNQKVN